MLRLAIPGYRLPVAVVERDIENVTALGVEIATSTRVGDLEELRREGYDAILVATGAPVSISLGVPGEDLDGVVSGLEFLEAAKAGSAVRAAGKRAVIVGGGNVAMDAARTARRLGGAEELSEPEETWSDGRRADRPAARRARGDRGVPAGAAARCRPTRRKWTRRAGRDQVQFPGRARRGRGR